MKTTYAMFALGLLMTASCTSKEEVSVSAPQTTEQRSEVDTTISKAHAADPSLKRFFDESYAYVVFPSITEGGLLVAGSHGTGWVYERGRLVGKSGLTSVSLGAQAGGQSYSEIMFFKDAQSFDKFKGGDFKLGAEANAVLVKEGAGTSAGYNPDGVAVFTMMKGGAMAAAAVGGQSFDYEPIGK